MKKILLLLLASAAFSACNENDKQQQAVDTNPTELETEAIQTGNELNENTIAVLDNAPIFQFAKTNVPQFSWNTFQLTRFWKEDSLLIRPFDAGERFFENYGPLLKYSADSSRFIDLDSYNISIRKNNKGERVGRPQGPDTEVNLVDVKEKMSTRLIFLGPGNNIEDAYWLDNQNLVLISSVDDSEAGDHVSLIKYNLPSQTFYVYETADSSLTNKLKGYWRKERLKNIIMQ